MAVANPYNYKRPVQKVVTPPNKNLVTTGIGTSVNKTGYGSNKSSNYLEQKILAARPEELTLMLYDGVIKFVMQGKLFIEKKNFEKTNYVLQRAQAILEELRATLNMDIEISQGLEQIYIYMNDRLYDANVEKDLSILDEILELAEELRDTWKEAMEL